MKSRPLIENILRCVLGLLLLWAAVSKLANPTEFLGSLYAYELPFTRDWLKVAAVVLPWTELLCGLLLIGSIWLETALGITAGLLVIFVLATGQAWARRLDISCGCFDFSLFGMDATNSSFVHFLETVGFAFFRNLALAGAAGFLLWKELVRASALEPAVQLSPAQTSISVKAPAPRHRKKQKGR